MQTAVELQVAEEVQRTFARQFPESLNFWADCFGFSPQASSPEIVIAGSPLERLDDWPCDGGLLLIGGPTRNSVTAFILRTCNPPLTFDDAKKMFLIRRSSQEQYQYLEDSHRLAVLEKLVIGNRVAIIAFGSGEMGTRAAVRHLIAEWKVLSLKRPSAEFARLLLVGDEGKVQVLEELP